MIAVQIMYNHIGIKCSRDVRNKRFSGSSFWKERCLLELCLLICGDEETYLNLMKVECTAVLSFPV